MAKRVISEVKLDDYVPQAVACSRCHAEMQNTESHYGRITTRYINGRRDSIKAYRNGDNVGTYTVTKDVSYPEKITGEFCQTCFDELWSISWVDASGRTRRAFENLNRPIVQPKNDDHDASPIVKGLYAPHVVKGRAGKRSNDGGSSPVIEEETLERIGDRKLEGFNRFPKDLKLKPTKTIVKRGKWNVHPDEYFGTKKGKA